MVNNQELAFSRVGTHDVEIFYAIMRILSYFNNIFDKAVYAAIKSILINNLCEKLDFKIVIRTRDNEGGANLTEENLNSECANTDFSYILDTLFLLFRSVKLSDTQLKTFQYLINNFTKYLETNGFNGIQIQSIYSGSVPYNRYVTNSYALSLAPIPLAENQISVFTFFKKDFQLTKKIQKLSSQRWFLRLLATMLNLKTIPGPIESIMFPIIPCDSLSSTVFNIISEWLYNFLSMKLSGEIVDHSINVKSKEKAKKPVSIIRVNDTFNYYESDSLPVDSKGVVIQLPDADDNPNSNKYKSSEKSNEINETIDLQPLPTNIFNYNIFESLCCNIKECVDDFIISRSPQLKIKTKLYVKNRLMEDLKSVTNFLLNNKNDEYVSNNINNINLYHCIEGKKIQSEKMKKIDNEANLQSNEDKKLHRFNLYDNYDNDEDNDDEEEEKKEFISNME